MNASPSLRSKSTSFATSMKIAAALSLLLVVSTEALAPVSQLLQKNYQQLSALRRQASKKVDISKAPYDNNVFFLRYCLEFDSEKEASQQLDAVLDWRTGAGKPLCDTALQAYQEATALSSWKNDPVLSKAPHAASVASFLNGNVVTSTTNKDDLLYCIRAGFIDDNGLMKTVTVDQLTDFFLYVKEVHNLVANDRSRDSNQLVQVVTANDLTKVPLVGGSATFRKALSKASKQATQYYPYLAGPTLLLNLPRLLNKLVSVFTVLFPEKVKARLKFGAAPQFASLSSLSELPSKRETILQELENLMQN